MNEQSRSEREAAKPIASALYSDQLMVKASNGITRPAVCFIPKKKDFTLETATLPPTWQERLHALSNYALPRVPKVEHKFRDIDSNSGLPVPKLRSLFEEKKETAEIKVMLAGDFTGPPPQTFRSFDLPDGADEFWLPTCRSVKQQSRTFEEQHPLDYPCR